MQKLPRPEGLAELDRRHFDYFLIAEVYHTQGTSYRRVMARMNATFSLRLTATPERTEGVDLTSLFDDALVWQASHSSGEPLMRLPTVEELPGRPTTIRRNFLPMSRRNDPLGFHWHESPASKNVDPASSTSPMAASAPTSNASSMKSVGQLAYLMNELASLLGTDTWVGESLRCSIQKNNRSISFSRRGCRNAGPPASRRLNNIQFFDASDAVLPADRERTKISVTEKVQLTHHSVILPNRTRQMTGSKGGPLACGIRRLVSRQKEAEPWYKTTPTSTM